MITSVVPFRRTTPPPFTGILHAVAHLPLLAPELLLNLLLHQCADPCAFISNALVLTTGATFLNLAAVSVTNARDFHFFHNSFYFVLQQKQHPQERTFRLTSAKL